MWVTYLAIEMLDILDDRRHIGPVHWVQAACDQGAHRLQLLHDVHTLLPGLWQGQKASSTAARGVCRLLRGAKAQGQTTWQGEGGWQDRTELAAATDDTSGFVETLDSQDNGLTGESA